MSSLLEDKEGEKEEGGSNVISGDDVGVAMRSGGGGAGGMGRLAGKKISLKMETFFLRAIFWH